MALEPGVRATLALVSPDGDWGNGAKFNMTSIGKTQFRKVYLEKVDIDGTVPVSPAEWWIEFCFNAGGDQTWLHYTVDGEQFYDGIPVFISGAGGNVTAVPPYKDYWPILTSQNGVSISHVTVKLWDRNQSTYAQTPIPDFSGTAEIIVTLRFDE